MYTRLPDTVDWLIRNYLCFIVIAIVVGAGALDLLVTITLVPQLHVAFIREWRLTRRKKKLILPKGFKRKT